MEAARSRLSSIERLTNTFSVCGTKPRPSCGQSMGGAAGDVATGKEDASCADRHEPGDGLDQGRLAGAVRSEDSDDLVGPTAGTRPARSAARARSPPPAPRPGEPVTPGSAEIGLDHPRIVARPRRRCSGDQKAPLRHHHDGLHRFITRSMLCSMTRNVMPCRLSSTIRSTIASNSTGLTPAPGSSSRIKRGSAREPGRAPKVCAAHRTGCGPADQRDGTGPQSRSSAGPRPLASVPRRPRGPASANWPRIARPAGAMGATITFSSTVISGNGLGI